MHVQRFQKYLQGFAIKTTYLEVIKILHEKHPVYLTAHSEPIRSEGHWPQSNNTRRAEKECLLIRFGNSLMNREDDQGTNYLWESGT